jgi:PAS domain S-box-containing protein
MDNMLDAVYWAAFDGSIAYANRAVRSMLGYEPDEARPLSVFEVMGPEELKQWPAMWDAMRAGGLIALEGFHRTKSGGLIPVEVRANLMTYEGVEYGCAIVRDVTQRREAEATLADSNARFRALSEEASWGVFVAHEGRLTYVNNAMAAMLGRTQEELIGAAAMDLVYPEDQSVIQEHITRAVAGESGALRYQLRGVRTDGELRHFEVVGVTTSLSGRRTFIGTLTDITERLRSERRLAQMNRALRCINACRAAVSQAPDERSMLAEVCRAIVEVGGHRLAWVGYAENDADRTVRPVAWAGDPGDYQSSGPILWSDTPRGRGPTGTAIRTGEAAVVNSYADDPGLGHWRAEGLSRGFRASIALPLRTDAGVIGAVTIYSDRDQAFDGDEAQLLQEMVDGVGVGITSVRARAARDEAELRLRSLGDNLPGSMIYQDPRIAR